MIWTSYVALMHRHYYPWSSFNQPPNTFHMSCSFYIKTLHMTYENVHKLNIHQCPTCLDPSLKKKQLHGWRQVVIKHRNSRPIHGRVPVTPQVNVVAWNVSSYDKWWLPNFQRIFLDESPECVKQPNMKLWRLGLDAIVGWPMDLQHDQGQCLGLFGNMISTRSSNEILCDVNYTKGGNLCVIQTNGEFTIDIYTLEWHPTIRMQFQ